ncbi:NIPSNAP family protein [Stieleria sp. TO1_6]|uniref:NIPSNAP family protein n=1 Tax=Stieleria tagensis TaxID=2956795 RepID=UPI00209AA5E6|nr:NIPSNAP family protein [Stieleria tagensis]MCO8120815.1 NIPSNAP family protein [Stieleria tagensis]
MKSNPLPGVFMAACLVTGALTWPSAVSQSASAADVYELRTYTTKEGKLDELNARFRDHTMRLFKKHGIESVGYWVPTDPERSKDTLIYVIKHASRDAAAASWKAFLADPEWKKAAAESGVGGLASPPESVYMTATDYSPDWDDRGGDDDDVFELRVYQAAPGKLDKLDARFRDHTIDLFNKHGIRSLAYWHPTDAPQSEDTLIYIIKHDSADAAKESWKSFGADPVWKNAAAESGVGRLAKRPDSTYMKATDYSPIK